VYSDEWMRERGYTDSEVPLTAEDIRQRETQDRQGPRIDCRGARPDRVSTRCIPLQTQDISQLPVFEGHTPVGAIYEDQNSEPGAAGKDLRKMAIREVMSEPLPQVPCEAPVNRLTYLLSHESPPSLSRWATAASKSSPSTT